MRCQVKAELRPDTRSSMFGAHPESIDLLRGGGGGDLWLLLELQDLLAAFSFLPLPG